jgi:5-methylcytosine-specific restriction enzyme A
MPIKSTHGMHQDASALHDRSGRHNKMYQDPRWKRIRAHQLKIDPLCRICERDGVVTPATICDHIEPHRGNVVKFFSGPFQSLCKMCHDSAKKAFENSGKVIKKIGLDGYPVKDLDL